MTAPVPVTVIIVSYNHEAFIEDALESVRTQTAPPERLVVIDNNSNDDTVPRIKRWNAKHPGVAELVANEENNGLVSSLNWMLDRLSSPLYTYMSADDRMAPDRLDQQVKAWEAAGGAPVAIYSNARRIDEHGLPLTPDYAALHWPKDGRPLNGWVHTSLIQGNWIPAASVLLSTAAVREAGGYDSRWFFEDYDLWLRLSSIGRFVGLEEPLVDYRELSTSLGHQKFHEHDPDFAASRVGILLGQLGVSREADEHIRRFLPHYSERLWRLGASPDLVRQGFRESIAGSSFGLRLRLALVTLGVTREPRLLRWAANLVHALRRRFQPSGLYSDRIG